VADDKKIMEQLGRGDAAAMASQGAHQGTTFEVQPSEKEVESESSPNHKTESSHKPHSPASDTDISSHTEVLSRDVPAASDPTPTESPVEPEARRTALQTFIIMMALCASVFLAALDVTIITTALPTISEYFHSDAGYTWIGSGYLLANAASTPIWGKLSDIWGRKPILLCAAGIFFLGSALAGGSTSIAMLIAARAIQGIGGGGLIILSNICIGDLFSVRNRGKYYGVIGMVRDFKQLPTRDLLRMLTINSAIRSGQ
jgi:Major Facilitator Superfamily